MSIRGRKSEVDQLAGSTRNGLKWSAVILARIFQTGPNSPRSELGPIGNSAAQRRQSARMGKESAAAIEWPRRIAAGAASAEYLRAAQVRPPVTPPHSAQLRGGSGSRFRSAAPLDRKDPPATALASLPPSLSESVGAVCRFADELDAAGAVSRVGCRPDIVVLVYRLRKNAAARPDTQRRRSQVIPLTTPPV